MRNLSLLFILLICCEAKYIPEDGVYAVAETMPAYDKGMDAFDSFVNDEIEKWAPGEKASVFVSFVVKADGEVSDVKVVKGFSELYDEKAKEIVLNCPGKWTAGTEQGQPVDVKLVYPVRF